MCYVKKILITVSFFVFPACVFAKQYYPSDSLNRYDIQYMKLDLEQMDTSVFIKGSARLDITVVSATSIILFDLMDNMTVDSVVCDNEIKTLGTAVII